MPKKERKLLGERMRKSEAPAGFKNKPLLSALPLSEGSADIYIYIYIYVYINSLFPTLHFSAFRPFNLSRTSLEARGFGASEEPAGFGLAITMLINHLIHERYHGWLGYRGDEILPNDIGIIS